MERLVEKFQCPGCVCGSDTKCGRYYFDSNELRCGSHVLGTHIGLCNKISLGMPKGFNKPGFNENGIPKNKIDIRLWKSGIHPDWDHLNVPVWAMIEDGYLFVRTFAPRINHAWVDVIEDGAWSYVPKAIDVSKFIDEID